MIGLSNKNETATIPEILKFYQLNKALVPKIFCNFFTFPIVSNFAAHAYSAKIDKRNN
jgi:hypothetical protein